MQRSRFRTAPTAALVVAVGLVAALVPATPLPAVSSARSTFIVELAAAPLVAYDGGIAAYAATSPRATGRKLSAGSPAARRYEAFLDGREDRVLGAASVTAEHVTYRYRNVLAGFAAELTPAEVARLRSAPGVRAVTPDGVSHPMDAPNTEADATLGRDGAAFLDLPDGLWASLGGPDRAGEGVVVGVIDTGIYPEHPSFAHRPDGDSGPLYDGPAYDPPAAWRGTCQVGEEWGETAWWC